MSARVDGRYASVPVKVGDQVNAGDQLADARERSRRREAARGAVAAVELASATAKEKLSGAGASASQAQAAEERTGAIAIGRAVSSTRANVSRGCSPAHSGMWSARRWPAMAPTRTRDAIPPWASPSSARPG